MTAIKKTFYVIIAAFTAGVTLLAWFIAHFKHDASFPVYFSSSTELWIQLAAGIISGCFFALILTITLANLRWTRKVYRLSYELYRSIDPNPWEILLIAVTAGWSEELVFRALLQPALGILLTSLLFALAHVGAKLRQIAYLQYGAAVFILSVGLGIIYDKLGLAAAMTAHAAWDATVLAYFYRKQRSDRKSTDKLLETNVTAPENDS